MFNRRGYINQTISTESLHDKGYYLEVRSLEKEERTTSHNLPWKKDSNGKCFQAQNCSLAMMCFHGFHNWMYSPDNCITVIGCTAPQRWPFIVPRVCWLPRNQTVNQKIINKAITMFELSFLCDYQFLIQKCNYVLSTWTWVISASSGIRYRRIYFQSNNTHLISL